MSRDIHLPDERYVAALHRMRALIASGRAFRSHDDDTPGDKSSACSWGLCADDKGLWPDAEDHLWPGRHERGNDMTPLYRKTHHRCPFDTREKPTGNGCFWSCLHFHNKVRPTKEVALALYDAQIAKAGGGK